MLFGGRDDIQERGLDRLMRRRRVKGSLARWTSPTSRKNMREEEDARRDTAPNNANAWVTSEGGGGGGHYRQAVPSMQDSNPLRPRHARRRPYCLSRVSAGCPTWSQVFRPLSSCACSVRALCRAGKEGTRRGGTHGRAERTSTRRPVREALIPVECPSFRHNTGHCRRCAPPLPLPPQQRPTQGCLNCKVRMEGWAVDCRLPKRARELTATER